LSVTILFDGKFTGSSLENHESITKNSLLNIQAIDKNFFLLNRPTNTITNLQMMTQTQANISNQLFLLIIKMRAILENTY